MTRLTVSETAGKAALKKSMEFFRTFRKSFLEMADLRKQLEPVVLVNTKNFVATHTVCHDILSTAVRAVLMNSVCFFFYVESCRTGKRGCIRLVSRLFTATYISERKRCLLRFQVGLSCSAGRRWLQCK